MATHSSILVWEIPWTEGAWRATVHGVARVRHDIVTKPPPPKLTEMAHKKHSTNERVNEKGNPSSDPALSVISRLYAFGNLLLPQPQFLHL